MAWRERPEIQFDLERDAPHRFGVLSDPAVSAGRALLDSIIAQIPFSARVIADAVRVKTGGCFHEDSSALAAIHGVSWRDVILANVSYDLYIALAGCSTIALPTASGPLLARNMDWSPEQLLARASYLLKYVKNGRIDFQHAGWPASLGAVTGMSSRGFALALNAAIIPESATSYTGYPVLLFLRRVLEDAQNFREALSMICSQHLAASGMITLVGLENSERVVIERGPTRHALRWGKPNQALFTTNHFRALEVPPSYAPQTVCPRYARLAQLLEHLDTAREFDDQEMLEVLTDEAVIQEITAQHVILHPASQQMRLFVPDRLL